MNTTPAHNTQYAGRPLVTTQNATFIFYDIESLTNVFTVCAYDSRNHSVDAFCLVDDAYLSDQLRTHDITQRVIQANPAWAARCNDASVTPTLRVHTLTDDEGRIDEGVLGHMAHTLGGVTATTRLHADAESRARYEQAEFARPGWELVCDTDEGYDPAAHPFITGYNSLNYDTVMLAAFFYLAATPNTACTARELRRHNDNLFGEDMRNRMYTYFSSHPEGKALGHTGGYLSVAGEIRDNWVKSGRHLDIARLNELQSRVGLKRLLGMTGHQILESDKLSGQNAEITSFEELTELICYNISDVIGTAIMFEHNVYSGSFNLRSTLLHTYPETVYDHTGDFATPAIHPYKVRHDRLTPDTSSAKLTAYILAPYRNLHDIPGHQADRPTVSFCYPDPQVAAEMGITPINVLAMTREFFYDHVPDTTASGRKARAAFDNVYNYYRSIEGKNFNENDRANPGIGEAVDKLHDALNVAIEAVEGRLALPQNANDPHMSAYWQTLHTRITKARQRLLSVIPPTHVEAQGVSRHLVEIDEVAALREPLVSIGMDYHVAMNDTTPMRMTNPNHVHGKGAAIVRWAGYICDFFAAYSHTHGLTEAQLARGEHVARVSWPLEDYQLVYSLDEIEKLPNNINYVFVNELGEVTPTHCFATFSTGGLHGAEYSAGQHAELTKAFDEQMALFTRVIHQAASDMQTPEAALERLAEALAHDKEKTTGKAQTPTITDTMRNNARAAMHADNWVATVEADPELQAKFPTIAKPNGENYTVAELARISWWVRKMLRVAVPTGNADDPYLLVEHKSLIVAGKADAPVMRTHMPNTKEPGEIFERTTQGSTKLHARYAMTSIDDVMHEDFTSYYPLMLTNMAAFTNPDLEETGTKDRYRDMFHQKERYGKLRKDQTLSADERDYYSVMREGVKLGLNSASGAADSVFQQKILMNNTIISMRLIGQLLTWWVGQSQAFIGARVTSTNTDGIYATLDIDTVTRTLETLAPVINVDIEPEPMTLVSKDSNNRIEFAPQDGDTATDALERDVLAVGGSTLAAYFGPSPRKALDHPAMSDRIIGDYFKLVASGTFVPDDTDDEGNPRTDVLTAEEPMHIPTVMQLLRRVEEEVGPAKALVFYQNIIASSVGTMSYLYAIDASLADDAVPAAEADTGVGQVTTPITADTTTLLQHYNRVFMVDEEAIAAHADAYRTACGEELHPVRIGAAKVRKVPAATLASRKKKDMRNRSSAAASALLRQAGVGDLDSYKQQHDIGLYRHTGVDSAQVHVIVNRTIHDAPREANELLLACLDRKAYAELIAAKFDDNWKNEPGTQAWREALDKKITTTTPFNDAPIANVQAGMLATNTAEPASSDKDASNALAGNTPQAEGTVADITDVPDTSDTPAAYDTARKEHTQPAPHTETPQHMDSDLWPYAPDYAMPHPAYINQHCDPAAFALNHADTPVAASHYTEEYSEGDPFEAAERVVLATQGV